MKKGFFYGILAALSFTGMVNFIKLCKEVNTESLVFFRTFICLILIFPLIKGRKLTLKTKKLPLHFLRSFAGISALYCNFYATKHLLLVDASLLFNTMPLFIPLIVRVWFKEKISVQKLFAIIIGFIGILFVLEPAKMSMNHAVAVGLLAGFFGAIAMADVRKLSETEPVERIVFYFFLFSTIIAFFPMRITWQSIDAGFWFFIFMIGIFSFLYQVFISKAYSYVHPNKICIVSYVAVVFSGISDLLFWGKKIDFFTIIGVVLVFLGAAISLLCKKKS